MLAAAAKRLLIRSEIDLCNFNIRIGVGIQIVNFKRSEGGRVRDQGEEAGLGVSCTEDRERESAREMNERSTGDIRRDEHKRTIAIVGRIISNRVDLRLAAAIHLAACSAGGEGKRNLIRVLVVPRPPLHLQLLRARALQRVRSCQEAAGKCARVVRCGVV